MCEWQFISSRRTPSRRFSQAAHLALCFALLLGLPGGAQNGSMQSQQPLSTLGQRARGPFENMDDRDPVDREKQLRALNADRQKSLVADTVKLLKLAGELNSEVSSTQPGALTLDQLHKLAEIEKLAHSVKEKMATSVRGISSFQQISPPSYR